MKKKAKKSPAEANGKSQTIMVKPGSRHRSLYPWGDTEVGDRFFVPLEGRAYDGAPALAFMMRESLKAMQSRGKLADRQFMVIAAIIDGREGAVACRIA